jgi:hypothetical protein
MIGVAVAVAVAAGACQSDEPTVIDQIQLTTSPPQTIAAPSTTIAAPPPTLPAAFPAGLCESYVDPVATGSVAISAVAEASGIAASRHHPGTIWMHNDSGGGAFVYVTDVTGVDLGSFEIDAPAFDWEDMAIGPGPDPDIDYLYLGDIGDNLHFRPLVKVYRFAEPVPDPGGGFIGEVESFNLVYPQPGFDSEALLVDPVTGDILLVAKGAAGDPAHIFRAAAVGLNDGATVDLEQIATFDLEPGAFVTAGDIDATGSAVVFRGYNEVWLWPRIDLGFSETFAAAPCRTPSTAEVQGEAIAFAAEGFSYYTISEGRSPDINYVESVLP